MQGSNVSDNAIPVKIVVCPACGGESIYAATNAFRPFCSARCKNIDFGAWSSEGFRLPAETPLDERDFGDSTLP